MAGDTYIGEELNWQIFQNLPIKTIPIIPAIWYIWYILMVATFDCPTTFHTYSEISYKKHPEHLSQRQYLLSPRYIRRAICKTMSLWNEGTSLIRAYDHRLVPNFPKGVQSLCMIEHTIQLHALTDSIHFLSILACIGAQHRLAGRHSSQKSDGTPPTNSRLLATAIQPRVQSSAWVELSKWAIIQTSSYGEGNERRHDYRFYYQRISTKAASA